MAYFIKRTFGQEEIQIGAQKKSDIGTENDEKLYLSVYKNFWQVHKPLSVKEKMFEEQLSRCLNFLSYTCKSFSSQVYCRQIPKHIEELGVFPFYLTVQCPKYALNEKTLAKYKAESPVSITDNNIIKTPHIIVGGERLVIIPKKNYLSFFSGEQVNRNKLILELAKGIVTLQLQGNKYKSISNSSVLVEFLGAPGGLIPVSAKFKPSRSTLYKGIILRKAFKLYCQNITAHYNQVFSSPESFYIEMELNSFKDVLRYAEL